MKTFAKSPRATVLAVLAAVAVAALSTGCELEGKEFRTVAGPSLEAGVTTLATGFIDAAFAVYMPDDEDNNSAGTASGTTTTGG